jgi:hypothetical protein
MLTKGDLVTRAETILNDGKSRAGMTRDFKDATSQLRNLVQITQTECDVKVLENFLNYQRGRRSTSKFWSLIHKEVVAVLQEIGGAAKNEAEQKAAVQGFFGYLVRHYVFLDKGQ